MSKDATDKSDKSKTTALLLCFFLGSLGAHYFYLGRTGKALLYLFTLGFIGIGPIIDLVLIATGKFKDKDGKVLSE